MVVGFVGGGRLRRLSTMYDLTMALVDYEVEFAFEQEPTKIIIVAPLQLDSSGVRCQDLVSGVMRSIAIDGNRWHMGINQVESSDMRQESPEGSRITPVAGCVRFRFPFVS